MPAPSPANRLTAQVIEFIETNGGCARRVNTQGQWDGKKWRKSGMKKGFEDVDAVLPIRFGSIVFGLKVAIEIKIGRDQQSPEQQARQKEIQKAGGIYLVAKTLDQFRQDLQQFIHQKIK